MYYTIPPMPFYHNATRSVNCIVKACMNNAKLYRNNCILTWIQMFKIRCTQSIILDNLHSLLNVRTGVSQIVHFVL